MLVVKIELWPHGDESRKVNLGTAHIINDGTGDRRVGNYIIKLFKWTNKNKEPGIWKAGKVIGFRRLVGGPWDLLLLGLGALLEPRKAGLLAKVK
jgi:hypothetical protein